ncbi:transcription initiation factor TFIID subunit 3 isoform X1 [Pipistrellus kuhlii]|uniref:Transcription initiation factor TFIID subunit 3 n=1 Tax=Pipistrellus kuhlii TaxID=59472 RepID=A0A7J8B6J9_PIPKU|nr:transcription initiation factor TFIID subunit 3 isoform X1 [Pipistrellus kuhlii]KAF6393940.1 TATA-box binding protein associated factor 3 [Pipistrellus kuhlii]
MCESYSRSLLRVSVAQICQALGWDSVQLSACHLLTDVLQRYLQQLGRGCHRYSELYGRTDPILDDVGEAFQLMGVSLNELEDYIHNIEPVTFPHQIPSFPVSKNNVLQFPQPGSKDAEERKEYIPDYMPPIVSSQEEEEEEQVPTDGGTSAEAMQVPLEEDDELEEEEIINDENFLGKRPLDSPEVEEMPAMKQPRLISTKGDTLDVVLLEAREPLSSINTQKIPPMLSPVHVQDSTDLTPPSPEPPMLAPVAKSQMPTTKPLEAKSFTPKTKTKTSSPGQKTKSPKMTQSPAMVGSPIRSPKTVPKEKKSPGRSKSPKSPKSPKIITNIPQAPIRPETPNRTPSAIISEKISKETLQVKQIQTPPEAGKLTNENLPRKAFVIDKTIDDSIDAVIARACAEREPDPFEFSSGSESEGDIFTSPKRISSSECTTPKASTSLNNFAKLGSTPLPLSGGTSSSDNSWTMDASIDEVVRKAKMGTASNVPPSFSYLSSPSVSPPTPEPLHKLYEEKTKLPSSLDIKKKLKKELRTKMKKKEKQRDRERERDKSKDKSKEKDKVKEKEANKEAKYPWKEFLKDEELDPYKFKIREFEEVDSKVRLKDGLVRKEKEKHKDKKKDREKSRKDKDKRDKDKVKDKGREEKVKVAPAPLVLPPKDMALPLFSPTGAVRIPAMLPSLSPMLPEKLFEEKERPKEKERKRDKKEKKKKKEKEKEKEKKEKEREKEKREREKREKEKEKHKHEKIKVEPVVPAPSPVIPRLTLRVGAGQDKIVISKVVPAPEAKPAPSLNRPKTPPPVSVPATVPVHVTPAPVPLPLLAQSTSSPALMPTPSPAISGAGSSKAPVRSVVTETVSTYVIRDEWGNQIWICPGCNKPDDGSPMIGCDGCDDWYHWPCVGIMAAPPEEMQWFCSKCANKKKDKKHKKRKHRAH